MSWKTCRQCSFRRVRTSELRYVQYSSYLYYIYIRATRAHCHNRTPLYDAAVYYIYIRTRSNVILHDKERIYNDNYNIIVMLHTHTHTCVYIYIKWIIKSKYVGYFCLSSISHVVSPPSVHTRTIPKSLSTCARRSRPTSGPTPPYNIIVIPTTATTTTTTTSSRTWLISTSFRFRMKSRRRTVSCRTHGPK